MGLAYIAASVFQIWYAVVARDSSGWMVVEMDQRRALNTSFSCLYSTWTCLLHIKLCVLVSFVTLVMLTLKNILLMITMVSFVYIGDEAILSVV